MKKYFIVYTELFNTRYFIGLCKTKKEALSMAGTIDGAKIEPYYE